MSTSPVYTSGSPAVTNPPSSLHNMTFGLLWIISGALTVLFPLIYRTMRINNYQNMYNMYNWEEAQQQYEQNQNEYYENMYQNQYGEGYYYGYQWQEMQGNYDVNQCKWYQFNCFPYYINENGEPEPSAGWYPSWFSGWTVSEETREQMMEDGEVSSALRFTYVWQIIMFVVILVYGFIVIRQNRVVTGVTVALVIFANMCFLAMWMLADGSIITDGENIQEVGFYGQFAVLMFMTNAWYVIFGIVFGILFAIRGHYMHREGPSKEKQLDASAENYKPLEGESPPTIPSTTPSGTPSGKPTLV
mmetsp:Transcript_838/g.1779  ORF Transcript_838/g.1779 Transcript_838/m.1779 type:complete len:303 (+) Transcript_838:121-1029(+)